MASAARMALPGPQMMSTAVPTNSAAAIGRVAAHDAAGVGDAGADRRVAGARLGDLSAAPGGPGSGGGGASAGTASASGGGGASRGSMPRTVPAGCQTAGGWGTPPSPDP